LARPDNGQNADSDKRSCHSNPDDTSTCCIGAYRPQLGGDKPVAFPGDGLDVTRLFRIVFESVSDLPDTGIDTRVEINDGLVAPERFLDLIPANHLTSAFREKQQ
jgi:hypothetical protein